MLDLTLTHDFTGKVVVVTGAGGVLCGDMARAYCYAGAKVAALDLNEEAVKKLAAELKAEGYVCEGYKANVLELEALEAVHQQILADLGPCDILINGAGGNNPRGTTDDEQFDAKVEGIKWLTIVAKVLLIVYSIQLVAGALFFIAMCLV